MIDADFQPFVPRRLERPVFALPAEPDPAPPCADPPLADTSCVDRAVKIEEPAPACDPLACAAAIRRQSIRLAASACARALGEAIARNPLFVARFVDEALRAAGGPDGALAHLHPRDARACAALSPCDVVEDERIEPGGVMIETKSGTLGATLRERAAALVNALADE